MGAIRLKKKLFDTLILILIAVVVAVTVAFVVLLAGGFAAVLVSL